MDAARREKWIGFLCLGVTAFGWALNWAFIKLLLRDWPPLFSRGVSGVAAALLLALRLARPRAADKPLRVPAVAWPAAVVRRLHQRIRLDGLRHGGDASVLVDQRRHAPRLHHADLGHAAVLADARRTTPHPAGDRGACASVSPVSPFCFLQDTASPLALASSTASRWRSAAAILFAFGSVQHPKAPLPLAPILPRSPGKSASAVPADGAFRSCGGAAGVHKAEPAERRCRAGST